MEVKKEGGARGVEGGQKEEEEEEEEQQGRTASSLRIPTGGVPRKNFIPRRRRGEFQIRVVPTYTLEEAYHRIGRGEVDVRGAVVVIDCITNDVRGTQKRPATTPEELVNKMHLLQRMLRAAGAEDILTCEIKPMQVTDVTPHNSALNDYLLAQGGSGYGCRTQIRLEHLRNDGFHVKGQYASVIDETYACALLGLSPPFPTPRSEFEPEHVRRQREVEWPTLRGRGYAQMRNEGQSHVHGWWW